jgi:Transglutaminase-like superfamily/Coenzyme PQQ synthesis protein D (PqqD)
MLMREADPADAAPSQTARRVLSPSALSTQSDGYRLADDVYLVIVEDGTGRLVDLAGSACAITNSGAAMLEMVLGRSFEAAAEALAQQFPFNVSQARSDMESFLVELTSQGLLVAPGSTKRSTWSLRKHLTWLMAPIVYCCTLGAPKWLTLKAWILLTASYLSTRLFGWPNTVRVWQACSSASHRRQGSQSIDDSGTLDAIDTIVRRAIMHHPLNLGCKERALCCQALTHAAALPARIVLGVDLFPFGLHCWCESGSRVVADRYEGRCDRYTPLATYVW